MLTSLVILMIVKYLYSRKLKSGLNAHGCYTMGITQKPPYRFLDKFFIFYSYSFKGKVYQDVVLKSKHVITGGRYLVYLYEKKPFFNRIDFSHQVTPAELRKIVTAPYPHSLY